MDKTHLHALAYSVKPGWVGRYFFWLPTLTSDIFAASWLKPIFSTWFERSISYLFGDWSPRLLNEALNINFGLGAAKISEVKVVGRKKHLRISPVQIHVPGVGRVGRYFFQPPTLTSDIFAAPWPKSMFSTSFERSIQYLFGESLLKIASFQRSIS